MPRQLSIGFKTLPQHVSYPELLGFWQEADGLPALGHGWLFDHLTPVENAVAIGPGKVGDCFEAWTLLTALAARTERVRLGLMVASNTYRDPTVHAQIAASADAISNGRIEFGVGAGWEPYEHASRGIPLPPPAERIGRLEEAVVIAKRLWTEDAVDFDGRWHRLREARLGPKPVQQPHPPVTIGGGGEQLMLRVVARHADRWNFVGGDADTFRHKVAVLRRHCEAVGRDPEEIELSVQARVNLDDVPGSIRGAQALVDAGATHVVLVLQRPYRPGLATWLAEEVAARIRPAG